MTVIQLSDSIRSCSPTRSARRLPRPPGECLSDVCDRVLRCVVIAERRPEVQQRLSLTSPAAIRRGLRMRRIHPLLARRRTKHGSGLGQWRWVVERTFAWLNQFRRLRVRYDKRADIHEAFLSLGCALIGWQSLAKELDEA